MALATISSVLVISVLIAMLIVSVVLDDCVKLGGVLGTETILLPEPSLICDAVIVAVNVLVLSEELTEISVKKYSALVG